LGVVVNVVPRVFAVTCMFLVFVITTFTIIL